jgi:vacuolar-type H+-ATPase subunit H
VGSTLNPVPITSHPFGALLAERNSWQDSTPLLERTVKKESAPMADKKFLSWVGFKGEAESANPPLSASSATLERIRELESQLNDLRSRRDITALTKEEFEILATETAMSIIRTAQQRESKAHSNAERITNESRKLASATIESAESKAKSTLTQAENRGRKYIEAAESDAKDLLRRVQDEADELLSTKKREASSITSAAKREAEMILQSTSTEIHEYRTWLGSLISEAERLYRIQVQSLDAAAGAISQSRNRLDTAFSRLSELQSKVEKSLNSQGLPSGQPPVVKSDSTQSEQSELSSKPLPRKTMSKQSAKKKEIKKSAVKKRR